MSSSNKRPKFLIDFDFYKDHDNIPIEEVAKYYGYELFAHHRILCPVHEETRPSCALDVTGERGNTFHCFACGESGNPLLFGLAVKYGIKPSDFYAQPKQYMKQLCDVAYELEALYPGGLLIQKEQEKTGLPYIAPKILRNIGLQPNFLQANHKSYPYRKQTIKQMEREYHISLPNEPVFWELTEVEQANLIVQKLEEKITSLEKDRYHMLQERFKDMPEAGKQYMNHVVDQEVATYQQYLDAFDEYLLEHDEHILYE